MFEIIEKELNKENIAYLKLTGQTKVSERINLVDEFNNNPDKKLFLISLKAGGTASDVTGSGKEGESYTTSAIEDSELSDEYELVESIRAS